MREQLQPCTCGQQPVIAKIGEWPAQYRVVCVCGVTARGYYYGSHEQTYRHKMARQSAIERWNKKEFEVAA